jgi:7-cyano-7-deazaguanine tRNA-ribosyltransferase
LSFEIRSKDLLGRIGQLRTNHGTVETPLLLPVINPNNQLISARDVRESFGFDAIITNSYLVWRRFREVPPPTIHELLDFDGVVQTDSGAYQILQYGDVEVQPNDIVKFQEQLDSDIAVILDVPTDQDATKQHAKWTVDETLRRAKEAQRIITRKDILWVGPVQGGVYPDLVAYSARETAKLDFQIHALGSPTTVMQQYHFDKMVEMIMAAKLNLPPDRPLHLFGAGHPMMFALAVATGCDMFDSASYALFARNDRYLTTQGTAKVEDLEYFPCSCSACYRKTPQEVRKMLKFERERLIASHNLRVCYSELQTVKQAISDGRLWELVEARSSGHPALTRAFHKFLKFAQHFERETPVRKKKGPFLFSEESLNRPEILRHQRRLIDNYVQPEKSRFVVLLPDRYLEPFRQNNESTLLSRILRNRELHLCSYNLAFGVIPNEVADVYPLSQTEDSLRPTATIVHNATKRIAEWLLKSSYKTCVLVVEEPWQRGMANAIRKRVSKPKLKIVETTANDELASKILSACGKSKTKKAKGIK